MPGADRDGLTAGPADRLQAVGGAIVALDSGLGHMSEGITARCSLSKKGLDSFWIVKALLNRAELLGIPYDQKMHDRVVKQLGPILWWRCAALNSAEKKALFICACDLYLSRAGNMSCSFGGLWNDLERALRERNYLLWKAAVYAMS